ncbi:MAG: hypothetical protein KH456_06885 [Lachnospira eligens]|jgi:DNA-binding helix-turn-helix protein|nr:hypothetical protein [Lachnospira eligens]
MKISNTSKRLQEIMKEKNYRQVDILNICEPYCKKFNIKLNKNDLSQYVNGKVEPGQEKLSILSLALDVSEVWLMGYDVPKARNSIISVNHKNISDEILYAINILANASGYDFSFFANQFQITYNDCIIKLSPNEVDDLAESSIEQIDFVMKSIITNRLKDNKFPIRSDLNIKSYELNAAHELTGYSKADEKHDNDIMDDDDEWK